MEGKSERRTRKIRGVMKNGDQSETVNRSYFCVKNDRREVGMNTRVDCACNIAVGIFGISILQQ